MRAVRRLLVFLIVATLIVGLAGLADVVIRHRVETTIATKIDQGVPGSSAQVRISSFPFLGRLAASGNVSKLAAHVTGVVAESVRFDTVDVVVTDVKVDRNELVNGKVQIRSIRQATITGVVSQASLDRQVGLPLTLGAGTVGVAGAQVPATVAVVNNRIRIQVPPLKPISITLPLTDLLPCIGGASLQPGRLVVTCATDHLPAALDGGASF